MPYRASARRRLLQLRRDLSNIGNLCFFAGSVLFLSEQLQTVGVVAFIVGSLAMLVGSYLPTLVRLWIGPRESDSKEDCARSLGRRATAV
ncbi:MAG: YrhK family protein [Trueperaceae bacterium]|nr:YrhK family protein [Trueperaceae bacterium]